MSAVTRHPLCTLALCSKPAASASWSTVVFCCTRLHQLVKDTSSEPATLMQSYIFLVSFCDESMEETTMEVMDMSVGDPVNVRGPHCVVASTLWQGCVSEAAAKAGQSVQAFLGPTQINSTVRNMLGCIIDNSRLCDSGFMTCLLAQLPGHQLVPIRSASAPLAALTSETATEAAGVGPTEAVDAVEQERAEFDAAAAAVAAAEAEEAAIDAVTDALLAQLGLIASDHASAQSDSAIGVEFASDAESDFKYISDGECEAEQEKVSQG